MTVTLLCVIATAFRTSCDLGWNLGRVFLCVHVLLEIQLTWLVVCQVNELIGFGNAPAETLVSALCHLLCSNTWCNI
jgi:hypothetical protein